MAQPLTIAVDAASAFFAGRSPSTHVELTVQPDIVTFRIVVDRCDSPTAERSTDRPGDAGSITAFAGLLAMRPTARGTELTLRGACVVDRPYVGERMLARVREGMTVLVVGALLTDLSNAVRSAGPPVRDVGNVITLDRHRAGRAARAYARRSLGPT